MPDDNFEDLVNEIQQQQTPARAFGLRPPNQEPPIQFENSPNFRKIPNKRQAGPEISLNNILNAALGGFGSGGANFARNPSMSNAIPAVIGTLFGLYNDESWANPANVGNVVSGGMNAKGVGSVWQQIMAPAVAQSATDIAMNKGDEDSLKRSAAVLGSSALGKVLMNRRAEDITNKGIFSTLNELDNLGKKATELNLPDAASALVKKQIKANNTFEVANKRQDKLKARYGEVVNSPEVITQRTPSWMQTQVETTPGEKPYIPQRTVQLQPETREISQQVYNRSNAQQAAKLEAQARDIEKQISQKQQLIKDKKLSGGAAQYQQQLIGQLQKQAQELRAQKPETFSVVPGLEKDTAAIRANRLEQARAKVSNTPQEAPVDTKITITPGVESRATNPVAQRAAVLKQRSEQAKTERGDFKPAIKGSVDADIYANRKADDPLYDTANQYQTKYFQAVHTGDDVTADALSKKLYELRQKYPDTTAPQKAIVRKLQREMESQIANASAGKRILDSNQAESIVKQVAKLTPEAKIGLFGSVKESDNFMKFLGGVAGAIQKGEERFKLRVGVTGGSSGPRIGLESFLQLMDPNALVNIYYNKDIGKRTQAIRLLDALNSNNEDVIKSLSQPGAYSRVLATILEAGKTPERKTPEKVEKPAPGVRIPVGTPQ